MKRKNLSETPTIYQLYTNTNIKYQYDQTPKPICRKFTQETVLMPTMR